MVVFCIARNGNVTGRYVHNNGDDDLEELHNDPNYRHGELSILDLLPPNFVYNLIREIWNRKFVTPQQEGLAADFVL